MAQPLFANLVYSEAGQQLANTFVGAEPFYILEEDGFQRHIRARTVDEGVLREIWSLMRGHEKEVAEQAAKLSGQEDIFSKAVMQQNLEHPETYVEEIFRQGIPEETRMWLGMMGFRVVINFHGELVKVDFPSRAAEEE